MSLISKCYRVSPLAISCLAWHLTTVSLSLSIFVSLHNPSSISRTAPVVWNAGMTQHNFHSAAAKVNILSATADELQGHLQKGTLTSTDLVDIYLDQIKKHDQAGFGVRAIVSLAPRDILLDRARELDGLRKDGKAKGPLHGIPVIVKDNFWTHPSMGMDTTCGSLALVGAKPPKNAAVIDRVRSLRFE
jgi:Amidase